MTGLGAKSIFVVGPKHVQNELLSHFLEMKTGAHCYPGQDDYRFPAANGKNGGPPLVLWDCLGESIESHLRRERLSDLKTSVEFKALHNLGRSDGQEETALDQGVWGLFYEHDPLDVLTKGVKAILSGEFWVSRHVLTNYLVKRRPIIVQSAHRDTKGKVLTDREAEILMMISSGSTNSEIGGQLNISLNTVKTHIYNIFQKIQVPNRLQAALWAGKHL